MGAVAFFIIGGYWILKILMKSANDYVEKTEADRTKAGHDNWLKTVTEYSEEMLEDRDADWYWDANRRDINTIRTFRGLSDANFIAGEDSWKVKDLVYTMEYIRAGKVMRCNSIYFNSYRLSSSVDKRVSAEARLDYARWAERTLQENGVPEAKLFYNTMYDTFIWAPYIHNQKVIPIDCEDEKVLQEMKSL